MQRFLYLQIKNRWRQLGRWMQLQLLVLVLVSTGYPLQMLVRQLNTVPMEAGPLVFSVVGLLLLAHLLVAPFIIRFALPRQTILTVFRPLPLSDGQSLQLALYLFYRAELPLLLPSMLLLIAVVLHSPLAGIGGVLIYLSFNLVFSLAIIYFFKRGRGHLHPADFFPQQDQSYRTIEKHKRKSANSLFRSLLRKDWLSMWRNPRYRRLKYLTVFVYLIGQGILYFYAGPDPARWMMLFSVFLFWLHFSSYFSSKYAVAESDWFFRTLRLPFRLVWVSRFLTELGWILLLTCLQLLFLILVGEPAEVLLHWIGALLLFALLLLAVVLNFQILFYDNPRLAGYSYHLTALFIVVLSLNYRFVGPLVALFFLIGLFINTVRFYRS